LRYRPKRNSSGFGKRRPLSRYALEIRSASCQETMPCLPVLRQNSVRPVFSITSSSCSPLVAVM
jgi:hypothetical protein